jgi:hypothetical protein
MVTGIADQTRHHTVAVQSRTKIVGTNEEILAPLLLGEHMPRPTCMELKRSREKIGGLRQNVMVTADPDDPSAPLQIL